MHIQQNNQFALVFATLFSFVSSYQLLAAWSEERKVLPSIPLLLSIYLWQLDDDDMMRFCVFTKVCAIFMIMIMILM